LINPTFQSHLNQLYSNSYSVEKNCSLYHYAALSVSLFDYYYANMWHFYMGHIRNNQGKKLT